MIDAVEMAQQLGNKGYINVVKLDVKNFFDTISLERLTCLIKNIIVDNRVVSLIQKYLYCDIMKDRKIIHCTKGLLQGSPISPILSNIYMNDFDQYLDKKQYHWIRYADDIFIFIKNREEGMPIYEDVYAYIKNELRLDINKKKSGVFQIFNIRMLGYDFYKDKDEIRVVKHIYQQSKVYSDWYTSKLNMTNGEYHLVDGGILTKKDYSLLFENSEQKLHIPVETTDTLCFYSNVSLSSDVLELMNRKNIKLNFFNKFGNQIGSFVPENYNNHTKTMLKQAAIYNDEEKRLALGKELLDAFIYNMNANLKYYYKKTEIEDLNVSISYLEKMMDEIKNLESMDDILVLEAQCRKEYYHSFNHIIKEPSFYFVKRTKRPPEDELNAMISFGNTILYNKIQKLIWKTTLDGRIGIIHASNRRKCSLNLDFADIFKPIIVDRVIFSLINLNRIKSDMHFQKEKHGVYLNEEGKRIFLKEFRKKLDTKITIDEKQLTYIQLIEKQISEFERYIEYGDKFNAYKYY